MVITLHHTPDGWLADFVDNAEVARLCGTTILPTPFTAAASPARVLAEIRALNPGAEVSLAAE